MNRFWNRCNFFKLSIRPPKLNSTRSFLNVSRSRLFCSASIVDNSSARLARYGFAGLTIVGCSYYVAQYIPDGPKTEIIPFVTTAAIANQNNPDSHSTLDSEFNYQHPYDNAPWAWKIYFKTKRMLYLLYTFLPCITMAAVVHVTDSDKLRVKLLEMLIDAINRGGCGFQKFGQWMSMRPDIIPPDVIAALARLRQDAPVHDIKYSRQMVKESFGYELDDIFDEFDEVPVASGTVAQVHRARLREKYAREANIRDETGQLIREVAVKVRHPNVIQETWIDIEFLYAFCNFTNLLAIPFSKDEFLNNLQKQIDFNVEANNLVKFGQNFKKEVKDGFLKFPIVSLDMLSPTILLESWATGSSVSSILSNVGKGFVEQVENVNDHISNAVDGVLQEIKQKKKQLASTLFDMQIKMFLRDNLVHGDLHAGNVLFDAEGNCCTIIDGGLTTSLDQSMRYEFGLFLKALCSNDADLLVKSCLHFHVPYEQSKKGLSGTGMSSKCPKQQEEGRIAFTKCVHDAMARWVKVQPNGRFSAPDGRPVSIGDIMGEVMFAMQKHGLCLRGDVANNLLTMSISEGLIRSLDPDFDMVRKSVPYFIRYGSNIFDTDPPLEQSQVERIASIFRVHDSTSIGWEL